MITKDTNILLKSDLVTLKQEKYIKEIVSILCGYSSIFVIFKTGAFNDLHTASFELGDKSFSQNGFINSQTKFDIDKRCKEVVESLVKQIIRENDVYEISFLNILNYIQDCPFNREIVLSMDSKLVKKYNKERQRNQALKEFYKMIRRLNSGIGVFDVARKSIEEQFLPAIFWDKPDLLAKHLDRLSACNDTFEWTLSAYRVLLPGARRINYSLNLWKLETYKEERVLHNAINNKYIIKKK
jgi:hypothetical protein